MPLGLAKDSMINLAEMAMKKDEEDVGQDDSLAKDASSTRSTDRLDSGDSFTAEVASSPSEETADVAPAEKAKPSNPSSNGSAASSMESKQASSYGQYTGFSADYSDFQQYGNYHVTYTDHSHESNVPTLLGGKHKGLPSMWCCVFPWSKKAEDERVPETPPTESIVKLNEESKVPARSSSKDDDESTASADLGEKMSEKDQKALLARLRLAQPDYGAGGSSGPSANDRDNDILKGIVNQGEEKKDSGDGGILKHQLSVRSIGKSSVSPQGSQTAADNSKRRSLFPQYEKVSKPKKNLSCSFAPMARLVSVKSKNDMTEEEKGDVWWQKSDYEEFRRTGRMITKAMLEGGSEIWLASNQSWLLPNHNRSSMLQQAYSLSDRQRAVKNGDVKLKKQHEATRDKWWHTFGHSRRGLEHVASIDEGRQRQSNVRTAIRSVIEEQRRQKVFRREDADKLRMISIQHTSWARDLALAAGASDADAVKANFDEEIRKSREFYLLKLSRSKPAAVSQTEKHIPEFMRPAVSIPSKMINANRLDANTVSQIRYRRSLSKKKPAPVASIPAPRKQQTPSAHPPEKQAPLKDEESAGSNVSSSMAKRAAGFASGEEAVNMSAVLTGMGAVPKQGTVAAS